MRHQLAIFDIDGTLTQTNEVDEACFREAVAEVFRIENVSTDWASYRYSTDSGILWQLLNEHKGREIGSIEIQEFKTAFVRKFELAYAADPKSFNAVRGAKEILETLPLNSAWSVAIATGAWKESAQFKLKHSGVMSDSKVPIRFADDHFDRFEIIRKAWKDAERFYNVQKFDKVVYVGDGIWDQQAAQKLGIGFVGIDCRGSTRLKECRIHKEFSDVDAFLNSLQSV